MPRKIRQLKADLRNAGFIEQRDRGKGSHTRWVHPAVPGSAVTVSGHDGDDAKAFQERDIRNAMARVEQTTASEAEMEHDVQWLDVTQDEIEAALQYAVVIEWSTEDDAFVASVPDFPGLHTHGATREEAATMANEVIALNIAGARADGSEIPAPRFSALRADNRRPVEANRVHAIQKTA